MNAQNPYSPPEVIDTLLPVGNPRFGDMDDKAFNKLYYRSCNVTAIALLLSLGFIVLSLVTLAPDENLNRAKPLFMGMALLYLIALIGIIKRTSWGRITGILACVPMLASIPIGTLIGVACLSRNDCNKRKT
jgi:hypothetical protein